MDNTGKNDVDHIPDANPVLIIDEMQPAEAYTLIQQDDDSVLEVELATHNDDSSMSSPDLVDLTKPNPLDDEHLMLMHTTENRSIDELTMNDTPHFAPSIQHLARAPVQKQRYFDNEFINTQISKTTTTDNLHTAPFPSLQHGINWFKSTGYTKPIK